MDDLLDWLGAFLLGQAIEIPIYLRAMRGRRPAARWAIAFAATAITHPIVWFVLPLLFTSRLRFAVAAEAFAVIVEAIWLAAWRVRRAALWSLAANAASFIAGLASSLLLDWP